MQNEQVPGFDKLFGDALKAIEKMVQYRIGLDHNAHGLRREAYKFAKATLLLSEHYHNALLAQVGNIPDWCNEHFALIEDCGETREHLYEAIREGMTEREYVRSGDLWMVRKHLKVQRPAGERRGLKTPESLPDDMDDKERLEFILAQNVALRREAKEAKQELRQSRRDCAIALGRIAKYEKEIKSLGRRLDLLLNPKSKKKTG